VAAQLHAPLGLILVRKIGVPGRSELAMGALAMIHGQLSEFRNDEIVDGLGISSQAFEAARNRERGELERRASLFPFRDLRIADSTVIVVDDGLATGSTMLAAVSAVRVLRPAAVVVAVPVGARQAVRALRAVADLVVCLSAPEPFIAVGAAYQDFRQLSDEEVVMILNQFSS
jgi:predicted phosphoribosyltransferase